MSFQRFFTTLCVVFLTISAYATSIVDVRLSHQDYDKSNAALYVNIDVRVDNAEQLVLAGQNYRIFYPSETLSLDQSGSKSQLSSKKYSPIKWADVVEHVAAEGKGQLKFDQDLGFANFYVELIDNKNGGEKLTSNGGWTIATLKFDVIDNFDEVSMVWGRESMSGEYATAYVEIAEWKAPLSTAEVEIDEYIDFSLELNQLHLDGVSYELSIGPNPTTDFVELRMDKDLDQDAQVSIRDMAGRLIKSTNLAKGSSLYAIDVMSLAPATYVVEISSQTGAHLISEQIVIAR